LSIVRLDHFLHLVMDVMSVKAKEKGLALLCDATAGIPIAIQTDERHLRQILLNLLGNAVKFTDSGQVTLRVSFRAPSRLRFDVIDSGSGIPLDKLESIFEPFEQAGDERHRGGGTGLGLAISRQLVRQMGGELCVESQIGIGSTFWFELDLLVVEAGAMATAAGPVSGYRGARKTVLVVDDVAENRAILVDLLKNLGFKTAEASNGREGLERVETIRPDLVLTDVAMPEMDGNTAMRHLRAHPELNGTPVIVVSARASGSDVTHSVAAGADAVLATPFDVAALLAQIGALLELDWIRPAAVGGDPADKYLAAPVILPPDEEMELLYQLAFQGGMREISQWAERIGKLDEQYLPFTRQVSLLAGEYQSKAILKLVEQHTKKTSE
jgi:CheY-like chemotaxis protein